jgi:hypothetical protein
VRSVDGLLDSGAAATKVDPVIALRAE